MSEKNDIYYMKIAFKEAQKAEENNEIPVGAIIVLNGKIVSKAYNLRDSKNIVTYHAEILAIEKANRKLQNWRLNECILYTTLQPCDMWLEVIKNCKIKEIKYAAKSNTRTKNEENEFQVEDEEIIKNSENLIIEAFKKIRREKNN